MRRSVRPSIGRSTPQRPGRTSGSPSCVSPASIDSLRIAGSWPRRSRSERISCSWARSWSRRPAGGRCRRSSPTRVRPGPARRTPAGTRRRSRRGSGSCGSPDGSPGPCRASAAAAGPAPRRAAAVGAGGSNGGVRPRRRPSSIGRVVQPRQARVEEGSGSAWPVEPQPSGSWSRSGVTAIVALTHLVLATAVRLAAARLVTAAHGGSSFLRARRSAARRRAAPGPWIGGDLLRGRGDGTAGDQTEPWVPAADADRELGRADATAPFGCEEALDDAVLEGVVAQDDEAAAGPQQVDCTTWRDRSRAPRVPR